MEREVEIPGTVVLRYPRRAWVLWRKGWYREVDGLGERCWIRFYWDYRSEAARRELARVSLLEEAERYERLAREARAKLVL